MHDEHGISRSAWALGLAGLLPQAAVAALAMYHQRAIGSESLAGTAGAIKLKVAIFVLAYLYAGLILSFLGGIWWGFAMRRSGAAQSGLAALAVIPSLLAFLPLLGALALFPRTPFAPWLLVMLGSAILLTLPVDRVLERAGDAPRGWLRFRATLSIGLGGLTILIGALIGA